MERQDLSKVSAKTFGKYAKQYAEKYFSLDIYDQYLTQFCSHIRANAISIVDVACGPGNVTAFLMKNRPDLKFTGVDLAPEMIEEARNRVIGAEFFMCDGRHLEGLGRTFDGASFAFGLSYLTDDDARKFFASLRAVLVDSAPLYLSTITGERKMSGLTEVRGEPIFIEYRPADEVIQMVERAGFEVIFQEIVSSPSNASHQTEDLVLIAKMKHK